MNTSRNGTSPTLYKPGQHHPRHPERDDVAAGDEHAGRIVVLAVPASSLRPAERAVRPEGGAEPGVEDVGSCADPCAQESRPRPGRSPAAADRATGHALRRAARTTSLAAGEAPIFRFGFDWQSCDVPDRNPMSPPKLPADGPVALLAEPVEIALGIPPGKIFTRPSVTASIAICGRDLVPSSQTTGRPDTARSASSSGRECARSISRSSTSLEQDRALPDRPPPLRGPCDRQPLVLCRPLSLSVPSGFRMLIIGSLLPLAHFVVVRVVGRRDLHAAAAEFRLGPFVGDQRNLAVHQRQHQLAAGLGHVAELDQLGSIVLRRSARSSICVWIAGLLFCRRFGELFAAAPLPPYRAPRPDRDARPRPYRRASSPAAWWRWSTCVGSPGCGSITG